MKITVYFKNGEELKISVDGTDFSDVDNNNVLAYRDGETLVHINWSNVLYLSKEDEVR